MVMCFGDMVKTKEIQLLSFSSKSNLFGKIPVPPPIAEYDDTHSCKIRFPILYKKNDWETQVFLLKPNIPFKVVVSCMRIFPLLIVYLMPSL